MEHSGLGTRLRSGDDRHKSVLLFDKGFTQLHVVEQHDVLVLTPFSKRRAQFDYNTETPFNRAVAVHRAPIEMLFAHCRSYIAFDELIALTGIDIAELVSEAVRCETNLFVVPHKWALTADTQSLMEKVIGGVDVDGAVDV
jgi:hypothetical protein